MAPANSATAQAKTRILRAATPRSLYRPRGLVKHHEYRYWTASNLSELPASLTPRLTCGAMPGWGLGALRLGAGLVGVTPSPRPSTQEPAMPEPGVTPVSGPCASEGP